MEKLELTDLMELTIFLKVRMPHLIQHFVINIKTRYFLGLALRHVLQHNIIYGKLFACRA